MKGLGACLLQNGKPVAFASKSLSDEQSMYTNIKREMLALVFGFHTYLFGKDFVVKTDHKLEMIVKKPLSSALPQLKRLLVKIQGYHFRVHYKPGSQMILSDTLSRLPNPQKNDNVTLDVLVEGLEVEDSYKRDLVQFGSSKQHHLQQETSNPVLTTLSHVIQVIRAPKGQTILSLQE